MRSQTINTYHFKVRNTNDNSSKYYTTAKSITDDLGIPRSSIYKIINRDDGTKFYTYPFIKIEKVKKTKTEVITENYENRFQHLINFSKANQGNFDGWSADAETQYV